MITPNLFGFFHSNKILKLKIFFFNFQKYVERHFDTKIKVVQTNQVMNFAI